MKMRNKGKVHPSPSSSSSSSSCNGSTRVDAASVLKLLPAAILALVSVLSMEDKEVFAYMVTKSLKSGPNSFPMEGEKKRSNKKSNSSSSHSHSHKPPVFDCDCFDCYTSFWYRWDSSSNRELIHQAIEAFEEHLESEQSSPSSSKKAGRGKKREKLARRCAEKSPPPAAAPDLAEIEESFVEIEPENVAPVVEEVVQTAAAEEEEEKGVEEEQEEEAESAAVVMRSPPAGNSSSHKGFARKMLPDVVGLLNSRLWSLWSPNA